MQRYRVNYRLLIGLFVGGIAFALTARFLWSWQVNRNANWFRDRSEQALKKNDLREAFEYLSKYVRLRRGELDAREQLAHIAVDIATMEEASREERVQAYSVLEETVRQSDDAELRRELAEMQIKFGRPQDAIVHIDELLKTNPEDSQLRAMRVRSLFAAKDFRRATELAYGLIGYDKKSDQFDAEKAKAGDQPDIYAMLAGVLIAREKNTELARRVIDQMVAVNPESSDAQLKRSIFLYSIGEREEAAQVLDRAYELDPTDATVLRRKGDVALENEDYDQAYQFYSDGLENYPERVLFYNLLAQVEIRRDQQKEAIAFLDRGIKRFGVERSVELIIIKIDLLFMQKDLEGVEREIKSLAKLNNPRLNPLVEFEQARVKMSKSQWAQAAEQLARVRPLLFDFSAAQAFAGTSLGLCYEQLGKLDLALQSYELVLNDYPTFRRALSGRQRTRQRLRMGDDDQVGIPLNRVVHETLALPEDLQDWDRVAQVVEEFAKLNNLDESRTNLIRAQILVQRKKFAEAKQLIRETAKADPDNISVHLAAVRLLLIDPDSGPEKAMEFLDKIVSKWGDSPSTRILRADLLMAIGGEDLPQQLQSLTEKIDDWSDDNQAKIWSSVGLKFKQLGMLDEALQYWSKAAELVPNHLPIRMYLFDLALQQQDDARMREAQQKILELVKDKNDSSYILTEVKRRIIGYSRQEVSREELVEARSMLDKALAQRPNWHELLVIYGQLLLVLNKDTDLTVNEDVDLALQRFDDALKHGPPNLNAVTLQVKLLFNRGLFREAREKMDLIPAVVRRKTLGRMEAEILLNTGDIEAAYASAEQEVAQQKDSAVAQIWFAKLAQRMGKLEAAESAFRRAAELNPSQPDNWTQLIGLYLQQKKFEDVERVLREAHLALDAEYLPMLTAKYYELQGRWRDAEYLYLSALAKRMDEVAVARRLATFYLLWVKKDPANRKKAAPYINRILQAANEERVTADNEHVVWARRQAARMLAASGGYQQSLKAQALLKQGAVDSSLGSSDQALLAEILSARQEPESQLQAIQLLEELYQKRFLKKDGVILLAKLLNRTGEWKRCETVMLDAIGRYGTDSDIWSNYVAMLIDQGEHSKAADRLARLAKISSNRALVNQLRARLAAETGDQAQLRKSLESLLPEDLDAALDAKQLQAVEVVAGMAVQLKDYELAEKLYRLLVKRAPQRAFVLTRFLALHGDTQEALQLMKQELGGQTDAVLQLAIQMLRQRRPEIGGRYDEEVNRMLATALRQDPESSRRQIMHAESLEIQEQYDLSKEAYEKLLNRNDMRPLERAAIFNNLSFLLALQGQQLDQADQLVNQAIEIMGPLSDVLDTRAVVRMARKEYDLAVEDMLLAVKVNPTAAKYFHLAKAQIHVGNEQAAIAAWEQARKLGLEPEALPKIEQEDYRQIEAQIKGIQSQSAKLRFKNPPTDLLKLVVPAQSHG